MIDEILKKSTSEMSPIEYLIWKEYIKWNQKNNTNAKNGSDAIKAAKQLEKLMSSSK